VGRPRRRPARGGAALERLARRRTFALAIGGITLGFGQVQDWGWTAPTFVALGVGFVSLVAFVEVERHQPDPLMDFGLFRRLYAMASVSQFIAARSSWRAPTCCRSSCWW
jgi:hypothetical protein